MPDQQNTPEKLQEFSQFVWQARGRGLSRRAFLRHGMRLGLSLPAIMAVLVGCGVEPAPRPISSWRPTTTPARQPSPQAVPSLPPPTQAGITAEAVPEVVPPTAAPPAPTPTGIAAEAAPTSAQARFAVIGDYGQAGPAAERVAALVKSWSPDFIVTTGDNNYPVGGADTIDANVGQYYHEFMAHAGSAYGPGAPKNRFFPVLGNHDADVAGVGPYFDYFTLPGNGRYYTVDWPPVRIYALNSVPWVEPDGVYPDSVQAAWLRRELEASPDTWNLVVFHHPPYSSHHAGETEWMRWPFREWGADAVISGHNHVYERVMRDGFPYMVNGLGGGARYAWGPIVEGSVVRYNADHGAMLVEATPERISFQFIVASTGEVIDTYVLPEA
ncbi:MAG: metallophosphoesterase [Chloroflexota bacterium]